MVFWYCGFMVATTPKYHFTATPINMNHHTRKGKIEYQIKHPDYPSGIWGFEEYRMTRHQDGSRVLRSYCELDDDSKIIRDAIQRVDKDFYPLDTMVRLTIDDKFVGSTWYHFTDSMVECQGFTTELGRFSQRVSINKQIRGFGTHALNGDTWLAARYDLSQGLGIQTWKKNILTSKDHRGATGPAIERTASSSIQYFGQETLTVRAGTFLCHHFAFVKLSNQHPPYHFWATADGDFLFVKGKVDGFNWTFELIAFE